MHLRKGAAGIVLAAVLLLASTAAAEEFPAEAYYIYNSGGCVTVWCDLTPCLNSKTVKQLKDGVEVAIDLKLSLQIPRRIIGSHQVAEQTFFPVLSYRPLTGEYELRTGRDRDSTEQAFLSLGRLYQYLSDSIEVCLVPVDSLSDEEQYELAIDITTIAVTDFNSVPPNPSDSDGESPIGFLFRQFLDLTKYGRRELETKSRPFSLEELDKVN